MLPLNPETQNYNPAVERAAIAHVVEFGENEDLLSLLDVEDFYEPEYREIWKGVLALKAEGATINHATICAALADSSYFDQDRLSTLLIGTLQDAASIIGTENIVKALRTFRIRRMATAFTPDMRGTHEIMHSFNKMAQDMTQLLPVHARSTLEVLDSLDEQKKPFMQTGFPSLDKIIEIHRGNLVTIGARPGVGKSMILGNIACNVAQEGQEVCFCSKEMTDEELLPRFLRYMERCDLKTAKQRVNRETIARISIRSVITVEDVERAAILSPAEIIIVDYIQLLTVSGKRIENRVTEIERVSNKLKEVAMRTQKVVLCASQIGRDVEKVGREPTLADLKGSGAIEQDSNIVILLHDPSVKDMDDTPSRNVKRSVASTASSLTHGDDAIQCIVAKNRAGQTGRCTLKLDRNHLAFLDPL